MGDNRTTVEPMQAADLDQVTGTEEIYCRFANREDLPDMANILTRCFLDFEMHDQFCPNRRAKQEEYYLFLLARVRMFFVKPTARFMVAERLSLSVLGQKSEILGFSIWDAQGPANPIAEAWSKEKSGLWNAIERKLVDAENAYHKFAINTIFNYPLFAQAMERMGATAKLESYKNNLHLQFLMVKPEWQKGHGIGRRLLRWGLDVADGVKLPVVIESSLAGYPFYLKNGCELVMKVKMDYVPELSYDLPILAYDPR